MQVIADPAVNIDAGGMPNTIPETLDELRIAELVGRFYDKVRVDALLGPVFNQLVDDWDAHKLLMTRAC